MLQKLRWTITTRCFSLCMPKYFDFTKCQQIVSLSYRHLYTFDIFANPFLWASTLPCFHTFSTGSRTAQCFGGNGSCLSSFICKISTSDTFVLQEGELQRTLEEMGLVWTVFSAAYSASGLTIFTSTNSFITMMVCQSQQKMLCIMIKP